MPSNKALKAIQLKKVEPYNLEMRDPLPLGVPADEPPKPKDGDMIATSLGAGTISNIRSNSGKDGGDLPPPSYDQAMTSDPRLAGQPGRERSDSDLARELQAQLNME